MEQKPVKIWTPPVLMYSEFIGLQKEPGVQYLPFETAEEILAKRARHKRHSKEN